METIPRRAAIKKILAPTDLSHNSLDGVIQAAELARRVGADLVLMMAIPEERAADEVVHGRYADRLLETCRMQLVSWFTQHVPPVLRHSVAAKFLVVIGPPAEAILEVAEAEKIDLIVMATHGRSGFRRFLRGSVAEGVIRAATSPVLTVRAGGPPAFPVSAA